MEQGPRSKFVKVKCRCGSEQIVFGNACNKIFCLSCKRQLTMPTGGKANIQTKILKVLE